MGYPSLLYFVKPSKRPIDVSVFEDLQLLNFIPKRVAKSACVPCERDNILPRQQFFMALSESASRELYSELFEISNELYTLDRAYTEARTDEGKRLIYVFLLDSVRRFTDLACKADLGDPISKRFAHAFEGEKNSEKYIAMCAELDAVIDDAQNALSNSMSVNKSGLNIKSSKDKTFYKRISSCAITLGVSEPKGKRPENKNVSPDIILGIAKLYPELMDKLRSFKKEYSGLYNNAITYYRKEIEFYLSMLGFMDTIRGAGIPLTYPTIADGRIISVSEAYDVSLLAKNEKNIVPNDISFTTDEPFYYLTGANGGGKTTYLRTVGIAVLLFLLGCPVPCKSACISDISSVFAHFPRDERFDGSGRFVEENNRVQAILSAMDESSLVLLNETYSTTNEENAVYMTEKLANEIYGKGIFGLYITHQHSLSESNIPYLNVIIDVNDQNRRTFKIAKQKNVGYSYARDILVRCGLTFEALEGRFGKLDEEVEK